MSVEVTTLANPASTSSPTRCRISRPPRSASGSAPAAATSAATSTASRISSNTWRSRARERRTARQIAEEIEAVGGDLNAATSVETHRLLRPRAEGRRAAGARRPRRHPVRTRASSRTSSSASRTSSCRRSAPSTTRPTIWCSSICNAIAFPDQPVGRSILGTPRRCGRSTAGKLRAYLARQLSRARHGGGGGRRGRSRRGGRRGRAALCQLHRPGGPLPEPARFGGGSHVEKRELEQVHIALALPGVRGDRSRRSTACRCSPTCSAAECRRGCSRRCAKGAACATRSIRSTCPIPTSACSVSMPAPTPPTPRS